MILPDLMSPSSENEFSRYEFKYLLNANQRESVENEVQNFMEYDGHVRIDLKSSYYVRSLYFDNTEATHFYEKIDGVRVRKKFRVRTYDRNIEDRLPIYLEEKGRFIERTYKNRIKLNHEHLALFENPERHAELLKLYSNDEVIERFVFSSIRHRLLPRVLVDYVRRPYVSNYDLNFRVTFDSELEVSTPQLSYTA
ncbi:MAG: hypothetical protein CMM60_03200 [Rhodospirillaceae bacterium]|jgi:hypothetical protein|nr:hypothetical protein [Rhodospirillaceae bacterium]|tara:strand:+ start:4548 stop:5135 length:588 start_codon:yes stop_codon:yes gene_type:complete